jgi:hypothetical protein
MYAITADNEPSNPEKESYLIGSNYICLLFAVTKRMRIELEGLLLLLLSYLRNYLFM